MGSCCHGCEFCGGGGGLVVGGCLVVVGGRNCFNPLPLLFLVTVAVLAFAMDLREVMLTSPPEWGGIT